MLYGLPPNLCCFVVPGLGKTPKAGLQNSTGASAQTEPKVGQERKEAGSVLTGSKKLSPAEPRLCTQPWSAICPKLLLEYVIIPIAVYICPKVLKKQIKDTVSFAMGMIDQLKDETPKNHSYKLKAAYLDNLIGDLNLYTSNPLLKGTTESFIKEILNQKFGSVPNEKFDEGKATNRIKSINVFRQAVIRLKNGAERQEIKEKGFFFESLFQSLKELDTEVESSIRCHDTLNQAKGCEAEKKDYRNQATFAAILRGDVAYSDDD